MVRGTYFSVLIDESANAYWWLNISVLRLCRNKGIQEYRKSISEEKNSYPHCIFPVKLTR